MKLYLKRRNGSVNATGEFELGSKIFTVVKGSKVSDTIAYSEKFRGAATIEKYRKEYVKNGIVKENVSFKSASTAANFVTGSSTNGLTAWKDEKGTSLKKIIEEAENE